jgi:hypothetical protein
MEFLCKSTMPLLNHFHMDLSTQVADEHHHLGHFLDLHPEINLLGLLMEEAQWKDIAPRIHAITFTPSPLKGWIIDNFPKSITKLRLFLSEEQELQDLWSILWRLAQSHSETNVKIVYVTQLETDMSWISSEYTFTDDVSLRDAQLIAGLLRFAILLKREDIQILDGDSLSLDDFMGNTSKIVDLSEIRYD